MRDESARTNMSLAASRREPSSAITKCDKSLAARGMDFADPND